MDMEQNNNHMSEPSRKGRKKVGLIAALVAIVVLVGGYFAFQSHIANEAEIEIARFLRENQLDRDIRYREIDASLIGQSVTLYNLRLSLQGTEGTVGALTVSNYDLDERSGQLRSVDLLLEDVDFPIAASPFGLFGGPSPFLIGMDAMRGDIGIEYEYDIAKGDVLAAVEVSMPDFLDGEFEVSISRFTAPPVERFSARGFNTMGRMFDDMGKADLNSVSLRLTDRGLKDRIAEYASVESGAALDGAAYRKELFHKLDHQISENPPQSRFENDMAEVAKSVLDASGGTLTVAYEPQYPTPFEDIGSAVFEVMFGGFGGLGKQATRNRDALSELIDREVLKIEFDS
ncbi:hypothetical protein ACFOY8_07555 [Thalassospira xianhensis]|uniref:Uncharacterized protein n=1 Tax=Thalassospira xianhensis MCCC 1A02616 TaxID=1177929 RepID=A0A367U6I2_9PROT|nr:hypothetical protein [Thalassospira xianhensis]RCK03907.1 hypothetical protein TH5_22785 [Thalassospira xianhensis MCCC 1A02616]